MTIDDEKLMAFADGELHGSEREAVMHALAADPALRRQLEAQRHLKARLAGHYGPVAQEEVPARLLAMLGAQTPADVASLSAARERRRPFRQPAWRNFGAIAATLAIGILAGQLIPLRDTTPIAMENGMLVAEGPLATVLETQLASTQPPDAETRIGVSFADRRGRACRTFDSRAVSGLACRDGGDWAVVMTAAHRDQATEYRRAGSSMVMSAAQAMMAGAPFDAAAERTAMESAWKISERPTD